MPAPASSTPSPDRLLAYLNLKLRELSQPGVAAVDNELGELVGSFVALSREKDRALVRHLCPVDQRIQNFLFDYLESVIDTPRLPPATLVLDRPGLARILSLPPTRDEYESAILTSRRVRQGVLHNPRADRRTTQGIFHVAEGGLPIPDDKKAVPASVFGRLLRLEPTGDKLTLGRAATASLAINDARVSRVHATVEWRAGNFILSDASSFGTWVYMGNQSEPVVLRRTECHLVGQGQIALGCERNAESPPLVAFSVKA